MSAVLYKSKQRNIRRQVQCQHGKTNTLVQVTLPLPLPVFKNGEVKDSGCAVSKNKSNVRKYRHKDNVALMSKKKKQERFRNTKNIVNNGIQTTR